MVQLSVRTGSGLVNGDELRGLVLPENYGYMAADVDDLLARVADEIDARRPIGTLVANATFRTPEVSTRRRLRREPAPRAYDWQAVDWLLGQLRKGDSDSGQAQIEADPWRHLTPWGVLTGDFDLSRYATVSAANRPEAWRACDAIPGTRLRSVSTGILREELRSAEPKAGESRALASVRRGVPWTTWSPSLTAAARIGERTFTSRRVSRSGWPTIAMTFGAGSPGSPAHLRPALGKEPQSGDGVPYLPRVRVLVDQYGNPILSTGGRNFDRSAGAYIRLPGGRWLSFPVCGGSRRGAIMTAVDQAGRKVAVYRMVRGARGLPLPLQVEIIIHPGQVITDEVLLILAVSAPWLRSYFERPNEGGG
jgi:hypothetical protein